jgi:hypothetical protein
LKFKNQKERKARLIFQENPFMEEVMKKSIIIAVLAIVFSLANSTFAKEIEINKNMVNIAKARLYSSDQFTMIEAKDIFRQIISGYKFILSAGKKTTATVTPTKSSNERNCWNIDIKKLVELPELTKALQKVNLITKKQSVYEVGYYNYAIVPDGVFSLESAIKMKKKAIDTVLQKHGLNVENFWEEHPNLWKKIQTEIQRSKKLKLIQFKSKH